jgi:thymidylate synthase (FAD)
LNAKIAYQKLIELGISKEQARTILPLNLNTTMIWTGSLYALIRLCKQRLKPNAQKETRDVVQEMLRQVKETNLFTTSLTAYNL